MTGDGFYTTTYDTLVHPLNELILDADQKQAGRVVVHIGDRRLELRIESDHLSVRSVSLDSRGIVMRPRVSNEVWITSEDYS